MVPCSGSTIQWRGSGRSKGLLDGRDDLCSHSWRISEADMNPGQWKVKVETLLVDSNWVHCGKGGKDGNSAGLV